MITGDDERTTRAIAEQVAIDRIFARVLSNQRADEVRRLEAQSFRAAAISSVSFSGRLLL
jgi:Cu+-exporting ATPase